jgi:hypothetical protein
MFDIENLMHLGVFNQLIPIWQVFFFIASLLPFLLWNRVKICLLITYMFTYYLGFMIQFGDYISTSGSMQPFVLYSLSGLAIAVFLLRRSSRSSRKNQSSLGPLLSATG